MKATVKQQAVCGHLIGTIAYMVDSPDLYDPKWTNDISELIDQHRGEYMLTDSEAAELKKLTNKVLDFVRGL